MQRATRSTAVAARPAPPAPGAPGFFTGGSPGGQSATVPGYEWFNGVQETLLHPIELMGLSLAHADDTLLTQAIQRMIDGGDYKKSCRVASIGALNIAAPGANIDGIAMVAGNRVLLKNQAAPAENGFWAWNGAAVAMTRTTDADTGAELNSGALVSIEDGAINADTIWMLTTDGTIVVGTTALAFAKKDSSQPGQVKAWLNFNGTLSGTITPRAKFNIGSITKNGTGDYTITFASPMADANYVVLGSRNDDGGSTTGAVGTFPSFMGGTDPTTSAVRIVVSDGSSFYDSTFTHLAIMGN